MRSAMWHSGRNETVRSCGASFRYWLTLAIWNIRLRLLIIAPLGAPVVPEV